MNFKTKIIKIEGKNLEDFFQNLITNDIQLLKNNQALYSAMLTPQGKFLADFILIKDDNSFLMEANSSATPEIIEIFKKYDLRETLKISIKKDLNSRCILFKDLPSNIQVSLNKHKIIRTRNYLIFTDPRKKDFLARIWVSNHKIKTLPKNLSMTTPNKLLDLERIKSTIPDSLLDLEKEKSFILNFNFDKINGVSFNKGCYIGQENTSRQNYRGKIKYLLKTVKLVEGVFPKINSELLTGKQKVGVMKSYSDNLGLALLKTDFIFDNKILKVDNINTKLRII
ncbi:hypothetical protein OA264_02340 [Alphaproteobacteria bacterium]|nr:hypothetical protein [Alphaproteobacteria bacterium]